MRASSVLLPLLALLLSAVGSAQSVTVSVVTPSGGRLSSDVGAAVAATFPAGPVVLPASIDLVSPDIPAAFRTTAVNETGNGNVGILHTLLAWVSAPKPPQTYTLAETSDGSAYAPHALVVTLHPDAQRAIVGTLRLAADGYATGGLFSGSAGAEYGIDLDGDTVRDVLVAVASGYDAAGEMTWARDIPIVLQVGQPRMIGLWASASAGCAAFGASVISHVSFTFASGSAAPSTEFGPACGATISGWYEKQMHTVFHGYRYTTRTSHVALRGASSLAPALLLIGVDRVQLSIPGTGCDLLTTPVAVVPLSTDAQGGLDVQFRVPDAAIGSASFQFITLCSGPQPALAASQGLSLSMW